MKPSDLTSRLAEWQRTGGPMSSVVVSSRVRLARNLAGMPFLTHCGPGQVAEIARQLRRTLGAVDLGGEAFYVDMEAAGPMDRQLLVERHLVSRQHAEASGPRGVAVAAGESVAVMVNEEDHLRIQVLRAGLQLDAAYEEIHRLDDLLERHLSFAFSSRFGYLTACPTNVGTALRLSVMLHLPGLKMTGEIAKVMRAAADMHLAVRGLYGEGTEAIGELFQVSNQATLGKSEQQFVGEFRNLVVPGIIEYEQRARQSLLKNRRLAVEDKVHRALAVLGAARLISSEETMYLLSHLRLGVSLGMLEDVTIETIGELSLMVQPAHLQVAAGREMSALQRGQARAELVRRKLAAP